MTSLHLVDTLSPDNRFTVVITLLGVLTIAFAFILTNAGSLRRRKKYGRAVATVTVAAC